MSYRKINPSDGQFFALVAKAAFVNPFSPARTELDRQITGKAGLIDQRKLIPELIQQLSSAIGRLDEKGPARIEQFEPARRDVIRHVFLFDIFHHYALRFDEAVGKQIASPDISVEVAFAKAALAELAQRGFEKESALRYFALFYQIRRAFHFIDRGLIGKSGSMQALRMNLWNNIFTHDIRHYEQNLWDRMEDFSTLLLGPTGCGKGAAAAAIGRSGFIAFDENKNRFAESFTQTFITINLSQYAETLLESELFGHTKGAFTGAVASHEGLFSLCTRHGSVFLDEIGETGPQIQTKLLKVLEERIFCPVGSHKQVRFKGRIIAATNQPLDKLRTRGVFRDDFYYRLCSDCIVVPSLRERIAENANELDELIAHTVKIIAGAESAELAKLVRDVIGRKLGPDYDWPGNVRELAQCVRRIIIKQDYSPQQISRDEFRSDLIAGLESGKLTAQDLLAGYCRMLYEKFGSYQKVAEITRLDRRTAKKYITGRDRTIHP